MPHWTFLRHGESEANAAGWLSGHVDVALTDRGRAQAREAAAALADYRYDQAWSSDLQRANETGRIVLADRGPALNTSVHLRERSLGALEGTSKAELRANGTMALLLGWTTAPAGSESHLDLAVRAVPFLASIEGGGDTLIVAHGGLIRVLVGLLDDLDHEALGRVVYDNCVPAHRQLPSGRWAQLARNLQL